MRLVDLERKRSTRTASTPRGDGASAPPDTGPAAPAPRLGTGEKRGDGASTPPFAPRRPRTKAEHANRSTGRAPRQLRLVNFGRKQSTRIAQAPRVDGASAPPDTCAHFLTAGPRKRKDTLAPHIERLPQRRHPAQFGQASAERDTGENHKINKPRKDNTTMVRWAPGKTSIKEDGGQADRILDRDRVTRHRARHRTDRIGSGRRDGGRQENTKPNK